MKISIKTIILISISLLISFSSEAQLFDRLKKRTMDKIEQKAEDKLVEELSEEIARRAFRPIEKAMDDMLKSSYEEEQGGEVDWEKAGAAYNDFLLGLNKQANVPKSYKFDLKVDIETKDGENDKYKMKYFFSKNEAIMGIQQMENNSENFIVIDNENDIIVLYTMDEGNKKAQAIPSAMQMTGAILKANQDKMALPNRSLNNTGKSKKFAGYDSEEIHIESEKEFMKLYVTKDFPVSFQSTFGKSYGNFIPENYYKSLSSVNGMVMYSEYQSKENKKYNSTFEIKKVSEESLEINNNDYGLNSGAN